MTPDPGWNHNPGAGGPDAGGLPPLSLPPVAPNQRTWRDLKLPASVPASAANPRRRRGIDKAEYRAALDASNMKPISETRSDGVRDTFFRRIERPGGLTSVMIGERFVDHVMDHPEDARRAEFVDFVIPALRDPGEVWGQWREVDGRQTWNEYSLAVFPDANVMVLVREDPKLGALAWTTYPLRDRRLGQLRRGRLLYRKPEGRNE